jgi:hypothetical protein
MGTGTTTSPTPSRGQDGAAGGCPPGARPAAPRASPPRSDPRYRAARMAELSGCEVTWGEHGYTANLGGRKLGPCGLRAMKKHLCLTRIAL